MAWQQFANSTTPATTLSGNSGGGITSGATSLKVASTANLPANPNFTIGVSTLGTIEWMLVTAISGTTLTVTRARESSTAASHSDGDNVYLVLTAGAVTQALQDTLDYGTYASRPTSTTGARKGMTYRCSDSPYEYVFDGSAWQARVFGLNVTEPHLSDFTQVAVGQSTFDETHGGIIQTVPGQGASLHTQFLAQAIPGSGAYYIDTAFAATMLHGVQGGPGPCIAGGNSTSSAFASVALDYDSGIWQIRNALWNSVTSFNTNSQTKSTTFVAPMIWVRIYDDRSANRIYYYSVNGYAWTQIYSESRTTSFTPSHGGLVVDPFNAPVQVHWLHFSIHA